MVLNLNYIHANKVDLDSLLGVWNNKNQEDTTRLKAIHKVAWYGYLFSKPDSALYFAQLMYEMANKKGLAKYKATSLNIMGVYYFYKGNYEKAIESYEKTLDQKKAAGATLLRLEDRSCPLHSDPAVYGRSRLFACDNIRCESQNWARTT